MKMCMTCFASVEEQWMDMHEKWHAHLDRSFDIAVGGRAAALVASARNANPKTARRRLWRP